MAPFVRDRKVLFGVILVIVGLYLFVQQTGVFHFYMPDWVWTWPTLLIGIGIIALLTNDNPTPGVVLLIIGGFFLSQRFAFPFFNSVISLWPLFIVLAGVMLLIKHSRRRNPKNRDHGPKCIIK